MRCWLAIVGYYGSGHPTCGIGAQGGHTAHHVGRMDADGMISLCEAGHDLCAGLAGRRAQLHFEKWLKAEGYTLREIGLEFYRLAMRPDAFAGWLEENSEPSSIPRHRVREIREEKSS